MGSFVLRVSWARQVVVVGIAVVFLGCMDLAPQTRFAQEGRARANELAEFAKLQESQKKESASKARIFSGRRPKASGAKGSGLGLVSGWIGITGGRACRRQEHKARISIAPRVSWKASLEGRVSSLFTTVRFG